MAAVFILGAATFNTTGNDRITGPGRRRSAPGAPGSVMAGGAAAAVVDAASGTGVGLQLLSVHAASGTGVLEYSPSSSPSGDRYKGTGDACSQDRTSPDRSVHGTRGEDTGTPIQSSQATTRGPCQLHLSLGGWVPPAPDAASACPPLRSLFTSCQQQRGDEGDHF